MKILKIIIAMVLLAAVAGGGWYYLEHSRLHPSTDDAYLKAHVIQVTPQLSGRIVEMDVVSHQHVDKGQLLLKIDPRPYQYALEQARAAYDLAARNVSVQAAAVVSARANVIHAEAALSEARSHARRMRSLVKKGLVNKDQAEHAESSWQQAKAALATAKSELVKAQQALGKQGSDNADVRQAAARLAQAQYDLDNTRLLAPHAGVLGDVDIRVGDVVRAHQPLFPMIEDDEYWVEANFKETDLERIQVGHAADIVLDMYPDVVMRGRVESLSPASGASFSLLPPENATGNWVKVTQRFPVRITVLPDESLPPLRIGASARVVVDTTRAPAQVSGASYAQSRDLAAVTE